MAVQCPSCPEQFSTNGTLTKHQVRLHGLQLRFPCTFSGYLRRFASRSNVVRHVNTVHHLRRDFSCGYQQCAADFQDKRQAYYHRLMIHGV